MAAADHYGTLEVPPDARAWMGGRSKRRGGGASPGFSRTRQREGGREGLRDPLLPHWGGAPDPPLMPP